MDAPKSRSWKSGFLKKHSSSVEVVDANHALKLERFVGQRVAATGIVADRRMRARTCCNASPPPAADAPVAGPEVHDPGSAIASLQPLRRIPRPLQPPDVHHLADVIRVVRADVRHG